MKKFLLVVAVAAGVFSCNKTEEGTFVLNGSVKGVDGKNIILERQDDSLGVVAVDTVKIENGKFTFTGQADEPGMFSLSIDEEQNKSYLIIEPGEIKMEINRDSIFLNKVSGTYNNDQLTEFSKQGLAFNKRMQDFQKQNKELMVAAQDKNDTVAMTKLRDEFQKIRDDMEVNNEKYIKEHPKAFISLLLVGNMFRVFEPDMEKIGTLYDNLDAKLRDTKTGKLLGKRIAEFNQVGVGKKAPDFAAPNPEGKMTKLSESLGKLTIIDFWASWCGPCRKANPELVAIYNEFHDKGLNIIGVSLDRPGQEDKWKEAIEKDKLTWTQVSNLKFWQDPIAVQYGVQSIPQMFLVNEYGIIVAKDLQGDALRAKIKEFLNAELAK